MIYALKWSSFVFDIWVSWIVGWFNKNIVNFFLPMFTFLEGEVGDNSIGKTRKTAVMITVLFFLSGSGNSLEYEVDRI